MKPFSSRNVTIIFDPDWNEYRVPGPAGTEAQAYYTDDRDDAIDTALVIWGAGANISVQRKRRAA